jgi:hypothetical protein
MAFRCELERPARPRRRWSRAGLPLLVVAVVLLLEVVVVVRVDYRAAVPARATHHRL